MPTFTSIIICGSSEPSRRVTTYGKNPNCGREQLPSIHFQAVRLLGFHRPLPVVERAMALSLEPAVVIARTFCFLGRLTAEASEVLGHGMSRPGRVCT
jgi:hypothetical protein